MKLYATPGQRVVLVAELALEGGDQAAIDVESGRPVTLTDLLLAFREDPESPDLGWVKVTVEPAERRW